MSKSVRVSASDDRKQRALRIARVLAKTYVDATCALNHANPFQLLVATILSAQCTDERVNLVTPTLFARYPTPSDLANALRDDVEKVIQSTGFFRSKAANLIGMAQELVGRFDGELPRKLDDLVSLPGVGRKTANVLLGTAFGVPSGVVVDTHVKRITRLLGLTKNTNPEKIERDLMELLPRSEWINYSHRLIHHGRRICVARRPQCLECPLLKLCPRVGLPRLDD
jgi:endonuclease III